MIRFRGLARPASTRSAHDGERGSALLMTVIFSVFAGGVMLVLLTVLLSQAQAAQLAQKNTRTGYAAQAGIQSTLSVLRSNTKTVGVGPSAVTYGDPTKLPSTLTGTVDGVAGSTLGYSVTLTYYQLDPTARSDAWLAANALPYPLSADLTKQPKYVRIVSQGSDSAASGGTRTITALYTFTTTTVNIPGGLIRNTDSTRCLKATSATAGSTINVVPIAQCTDNTLNMWVYDTDYKLKLASTVKSATVLCITGRQWGTSTNQVNATLRACAATNKAAHGNQLWSWEPPGSWVSQNEANTSRGGRWLGISGTTVIERTTAAASFEPSPSVGAGAASIDTKQIVNFSEFGRCMDVTDEQISKSFMIIYPCKQDPTGTGNDLRWNHKWNYSEPTGSAKSSAAQAIYVRAADNKYYCLTTRTLSSGNTDVYFVACSNPTNASSLNNQQKFIRNTDTVNALNAYTFQLASNPSMCLAAVPEPGYAWSHLRLIACNGSATQKWNAPAMTSGSTFGDYKEIG